MITATIEPRAKPATAPAKSSKQAPKPAASEKPQFITPAQYLEQVSKIRTTLLQPGMIDRICPPEYQRAANQKQVKRIERALLRGEYVPDVILAQRPAANGGKDEYFIVDGLQRATAAKNVSFPIRATVIAFGSEKRECEHFVNFQYSVRVSSDHLVRVNKDNPVNVEVARINGLAGHPMCGKLWYGDGKQPDDTIKAMKIVKVVTAYKLPLEDLAEFTKLVMTIWPLEREGLPYRAGSLRGLRIFFDEISDKDFDVREARQVEHMRAFDWAAHELSAKDNSQRGGEAVAKALLSHWAKFKG